MRGFLVSFLCAGFWLSRCSNEIEIHAFYKGNTMKTLLILILVIPLWGQYDALNQFLDNIPSMLNELSKTLREEEMLESQRQRLINDQKRLALEQQQSRQSHINRPQVPVEQPSLSIKGIVLVADLEGMAPGEHRYLKNKTDDLYLFDTNKDGLNNLAALDRDGDKLIDMIVFDRNADGLIDRLVSDMDNNCTLEFWLFDNNLDGKWDKIGIDTDLDYNPDYYMDHDNTHIDPIEIGKIW